MVQKVQFVRAPGRTLEDVRCEVVGGWAEPGLDLFEDGLTIADRLAVAANDEPLSETTNPAEAGSEGT